MKKAAVGILAALLLVGCSSGGGNKPTPDSATIEAVVRPVTAYQHQLVGGERTVTARRQP